MDQVCRICLKTNVDNSFAKLTNQCDAGLSIYDCFKILTCIDLEDQNERDLSRMCKECLEKLISSFNFRSLAIENSDYFKNLKIGISEKNPLFDEPEDVKNFILNDFTGYQADETLDNDFSSFVKVESEADSYLYSTVSIKEEEQDEPVETSSIELKKYMLRENHKPKIIFKMPTVTKQKLKPLISCLKIGCEETFISKARMLKHKRFAHPNLRIRIVPDCKKKNNEAKKVKRILCTFCGQSLRLESIKNHILRFHSAVKISKVVCDYCGSGFLHKNTMRDHMFRHIQYKSFSCDECDYLAVSQSMINMHKRNKHIEVAYNYCKFPQCNYKCRLEVQMKVHIKNTHLKIKNAPCEKCNKSFFDKYALKKHMDLHIEERNFECDICKQRFKSHFSRCRHIRDAHQEKKYLCTICAKSFQTPSYLKGHMAAHNGIKEEKCSMCDKKYTTRKYLLDHIKEIHFKNKITCEICGTKLARMVNYKMHVKAKHKDIGEDALTALKLRMKKLKPDYEKMEYYYEI